MTDMLKRPAGSPLLAAALGPGRPELSCVQCFEQLDRYVELQLAGAPADDRISGMAAHLDGCPACREDHESLTAFLAGS